jgi:hypothetical protein
MKHVTKIALMAMTVTGVAALIDGPYTPYSYFPAMGHSSDSLKNVNSEQVFQENASVTDTDQWIRTEDEAIVTLPNPDTSITETIRSGTLLSKNANYNSTTGEHSYTYNIKAKTIPPETTETYFDDFQAHDDGAQNTDPAVQKNTCTVIESGAHGTGG